MKKLIVVLLLLLFVPLHAGPRTITQVKEVHGTAIYVGAASGIRIIGNRISSTQSTPAYCKTAGIVLDNCVAIGDGESDLAIFRKCGRSIALNYSDAMRGKASDYIITDDLFEVTDILESWMAE